MKEIVDRLMAMQDPDYREFQKRLIPNIDGESIIGVRTPRLRAYARELSKDSRRGEFLAELPHRYYEENNLHAWLVASCSRDIEVVLARVNEFLPHIDNWATCDMFSPKIFGRYPERVEADVRRWLTDSHTYTVRFGIVTLLGFYLDDNFRTEHLDLVASVANEDYYVRMAVAWYFSTALVKQFDAALPVIENRRLDRWTHNKSIQKAVESFRIGDERKVLLRSLKM